MDAISSSLPVLEKDGLLELIATLWACTVLFSLSSVPEWFDYVYLVRALPAYVELGLAAIAAYVLLRPTLKSFLFLLVAQIGEVIFSMPEVPNHRMLMTFVSLSFLGAFLTVAFKRRQTNLHSSSFFPEAIQLSRIAFLVVYFFAALAKMNSSFVDPSLSCSVKFYANVVNWFPFLPESSFFNYLSIYGPLLVEIVIPLGLLSKRFRKISIIVGLLFHFVLALDLTQRFLNFSMVVSFLYLLFLDSEYLTNLFEKWKRKMGKNTLFLAFLTIFIFGFFQAHLSWTTLLVVVEHVVWTVLFLGMFLAVLRSPPPIEKRRPFSAFQICILLLLILNGSSPYLGTKTRTSFNMYSNLRIEPEFSNHHFMGKSLDLFGHLSDEVEIKKIEPPEVQDEEFAEGMKITYFEFSRYFLESSEAKLKIDYMRNGQIYRATKNAAPEPHSWIERKLLTYRPLGSSVVKKCIW